MKKLKAVAAQMISIKLPASFIQDLKTQTQKHLVSISTIVDNCLKNSGANCPVCKRRWPKETEAKLSFTTRVNPKTVETAENKDMPSRYYSAVLLHSLGYCPVCCQKNTK